MITPFSCAQSAPKETVFGGNWFKGRADRALTFFVNGTRWLFVKLVPVTVRRGRLVLSNNYLDRIERNRKWKEKKKRKTEQRSDNRFIATDLSRLWKFLHVQHCRGKTSVIFSKVQTGWVRARCGGRGGTHVMASTCRPRVTDCERHATIAAIGRVIETRYAGHGRSR